MKIITAIENLTTKNIVDAYNDNLIDDNDQYIKSYKSILEYFKKSLFSKEEFIVGCHIVYGWMPRVVRINFDYLEEATELLNKVKDNAILNTDELLVLKKCIDNSMIGVSKLLHFTNPKLYPIWDSKIYFFIAEKKKRAYKNEEVVYFAYLSKMDTLSKDVDLANVISKVKKDVGFSISNVRALEIIMFYDVRNRGKM